MWSGLDSWRAETANLRASLAPAEATANLGTNRLSDRKGTAVAGKFVIKKGTTGKFRFNLLARNGQAVATSEA